MKLKLTSALVGLAALGGVALSAGTASAMPIGVPAQASNIEQAAYVCNPWGHCWWRPNYGYGYGYYRPHYYGGWGWHRWHRWHHWHHW
jgi:hypothetical protein